MAVGGSRKVRAARRRKRRMRSVAHDLTDAQWTALRDAWGGCAYCGATGLPLQRDCVLPISRGGRYTLVNVVPACRSCNTSKCNDEVTAWLRRKRFDERAFLLRHAQIRADLELHLMRRQLPPACPGGTREGNASTESGEVVVARVGEGQLVFPVDGPEST